MDFLCIGFKGNARVILPGLTACVDCTLDLYPPQVQVSIKVEVMCMPAQGSLL